MLISGPANLSVLYSKKDKHYVYVFGDIHEDLKYLCKDQKNVIWDFLYNLIKLNQDKLFNILIETYQIDDDVNFTFNNIDTIYHIIDKFKCFSKEKNKNQFSNAMIHYVDYRIMTSYGFIANKFHINFKKSYEFFNNIEIIDNNMLHLLLMHYENKKDLNNLHYYISSLRNILSKFKMQNNMNTINDYINVFKEYMNYSKIDKQYSNIHDDNYISILYKYADDFFNYIKNKYNNINFNEIFEIFINTIDNWHKLKHKKSLFTDTQVNKLYLFYNFNFEIQLILMDMYAMGRLLRHFDEYNDVKFKNNNKYSFFYVGSKHGGLYTKLLKEMNFDILYTSNNYDKKKRCIEINDNAFSDFKLL